MLEIKDNVYQLEKTLENIHSSEVLTCICCEGNPDTFIEKAQDWIDKKIEVIDDIDKNIQYFLNEMFAYIGWGVSAANARTMVIRGIFTGLNKTCIVTNQNKDIFIYDENLDKRELEKIIDKINAVFVKEFNNKILLKKPDSAAISEVFARIEETKKFYFTENGEWTQEFIDNLGDELSKISFRTFLFQRIEAQIFWCIKNRYPIKPPKESSEWRKHRIANPPALPILDHCSTKLRDFFYRHSFVFEQYGIENVVEAQLGDTVIDAGAYIGDTALYFASKIGAEGKVYAFEVVQKSIDAANDNLKKNNVSHVEMINLALSDKEETLCFEDNETPSSTKQRKNGELEVQAVTLDLFVKERNIKVDFIKIDIEGGEMALLKGAKNTIMRDKPTCGIALYHKQEDFVVIPQFLSSLCSEYTFYFRCEAEPVLLAKIKK